MNKAIIPSIYQRLGEIVFLSACFSLLCVNGVMAEPKFQRTLTVTGNGMETIATTIAEVQLGVEVRGKNAAEVQAEIAKRTTAVVGVLQGKDITKLKTTGISLYPNYEQPDPNNGQTVLTGYTGTNTVSFRVPTERVGSLVDAAVEAGASRIDGVSFTATPEAIFTAKKSALRQASLNAQDQADAVLESLNLESKEVIKIEVDQARIEQPSPLAGDVRMASESKMSTPVIGGEQTVEASVTLQITY